MKRTTLSGFTVNPYRSVHQMGIVVANGQTDSRSSRKKLPSSAGLKKAVEHMWQVVGMDAGAGVGYVNQKLPRLHPRRYPNTAVGGRKLEGVGQQVVENLPALFAVEVCDERGVNAQIVVVPNLFMGSQRLELTEVDL